MVKVMMLTGIHLKLLVKLSVVDTKNSLSPPLEIK